MTVRLINRNPLPGACNFRTAIVQRRFCCQLSVAVVVVVVVIVVVVVVVVAFRSSFPANILRIADHK